MSSPSNSPLADDKHVPTSITIDNLDLQNSSRVESLDTEAQNVPTTTTNAASIGPEQNHEDIGYNDNSNVPKLAYLQLFWFFFYNFGLFAWGGPVAQIALIKERLVIKDKWITVPRFQRVFSVYQILPGPEAAELCMFFGCLSAGRIGGIVAGIAFILPGFVLMLLASYLYSLAGFENKYFNASFRALQPIVAAMILRATHKIAEHSVVRQDSRKLDPFLVLAAILTFVNCAMRINMYGLFHVTGENCIVPIRPGIYGILYVLVHRRWWIPAALLFVMQYVGYALYVVYRGVPSPVALGLGICPTPSLINLFVLGLVAGSLSFGGAYTAIPFIQVEAVLKGGWLTQNVFVDCIAIGNLLPAPLVIFATFVGFQGGLVEGSLGTAFAGAIVITLGMFFPCFVFTIAGHELLEKLVRNKVLSSFFDGLCASVIGVIAVVAAQILKSSVEGNGNARDEISQLVQRALRSGGAAVLYLLALAVLYKFTNKWTPLLLLIVGAIAGQFLFVDDLA